jgi:hypothetical protein
LPVPGFKKTPASGDSRSQASLKYIYIGAYETLMAAALAETVEAFPAFQA